jgi:hypothetical protein
MQSRKAGRDSARIFACPEPRLSGLRNNVQRRFLKGQDLSVALPKRVALLDDDPDALTLLCKIVQMRTTDIADTFSLSGLTDLAIVCDKYQCKDAVGSSARVQCSQKLSNPAASRFEKLLFVTYALDLLTKFGQISSQLTYDHTAEISSKVATNGITLIAPEFMGRSYRNSSNRFI